MDKKQARAVLVRELIRYVRRGWGHWGSMVEALCPHAGPITARRSEEYSRGTGVESRPRWELLRQESCDGGIVSAGFAPDGGVRRLGTSE